MNNLLMPGRLGHSEMTLATDPRIDARIGAALEDLLVESRCRLAHNPNFAAGLSTSLHRGIAALDDNVDTGPLVEVESQLAIIEHIQRNNVSLFELAEKKLFLFPDQGVQETNRY